jgi:FkbM family methyltransferase
MILRTVRIGIVRFFQTILLLVYRAAVVSGILSTSWGRTTFERAYMVYKNRFEATTVNGLRSVVSPGDSVIDVGANIGFFTLRFGQWITQGAKVFALEPEPVNFSRLKRNISRAKLDDRVEALCVAVSESSGEVLLVVDPVHPGNHKLGETGIPVQSISIDALLAQNDWPRVALIKIDVQGAERRVIAGATETLRRFHPALFVELDRDSNADDLLQQIIDLGYSPYVLRKSSPPLSITPERARQLITVSGYHDFLFLSAQAVDNPGLPLN